MILNVECSIPMSLCAFLFRFTSVTLGRSYRVALFFASISATNLRLRNIVIVIAGEVRIRSNRVHLLCLSGFRRVFRYFIMPRRITARRHNIMHTPLYSVLALRSGSNKTIITIRVIFLMRYFPLVIISKCVIPIASRYFRGTRVYTKLHTSTHCVE